MRRLSDLHYEILEDSALRWRPILASQAAAYFPDAEDPERQASRTLRALEKNDWLASKEYMFNDLPEITRPLCSWKPGEPWEPNGKHDPEKLSNTSRQRWEQSKLRTERVFFASKKTLRLHGAPTSKDDSPMEFSKANHDLLLTSAVMFIRKHRPEVFPLIRHESVFERHYMHFADKIPDAIIVEDGDYLNPLGVIDSAGSYTGAMLLSFLRRWGIHSKTPTPFALF